MFIMIVHYTSLPGSIERAQGVMPEIERIKKNQLEDALRITHPIL